MGDIMTIQTIGIVGAGTMGSALAQKFAQEGLSVILMDREQRFTDRGMSLIQGTLQEGAARRLFTEEDIKAILSRIQPTTDLVDLKRCDLIIEAVFEDLKVKQDLFQSLSGLVSQDTILASNTSSFRISDLAQSLSHPEWFLGLHFFYHAAKNRLVEVVAGEDTDPALIPEIMAFMQRVGKDPITCRDSHGFVVNRFFVPWLNEAVRLLEEGVADTGAIDAVACETFGCGMGPFALMNATGVPIAYHAERSLESAFGSFYAPAEGLMRQTESGQNWEISGGKPTDEETARTIADRLVGSVLLICGQLLDENVCTAGDLSRGAGVGLRWSKTPVTLMETLGHDQARDIIQNIAERYSIPLPMSLSPEDWEPDFVQSKVEGTVGTLILNRPEGLNALNPLVMDQLDRHFQTLDSDPHIDTIVITGLGKAFVAGADIKFFVDHIQQGTIPQIVEFTRRGQALFRRIDESPKRVIALLNGLALGGGLELALTADTIIALKSARMAFPETGIGIYPGLGGTSRPVRRIGLGLTKFLVYTGQMVSATQALEMGLVDDAVDWDEFQSILNDPKGWKPQTKPASDTWKSLASLFDRSSVEDLQRDSSLTEREQKWVKKLAYKAPLALKLAEKLIDAQEGPEAELKHLDEIFRTQDALTGLRSVLTGERPVFKGA